MPTFPRTALFIVVAATRGCGAGTKQTKATAVDPRVQKRDQQLAKLREYQGELDRSHFRYTAHATNYERSKDDYQKKLTLAMAAKKASGRQLRDLEDKRGQLSRMIADRDRVGAELNKSFETLIAAQKRRNASALALLELEGKLWELEEKAVGGRDKLAAAVAADLAEVRTAAGQVADAARTTEDAEQAVVNKEVEVAALIGTDVQKRDEADQALDKLRETLEAAATAHVGSLSTYETAKIKYHAKVIALIKPGPDRDQVQVLLDRRQNAAKQLEEAQSIVKTATVDRAAQMKQRIAYDSEIDRVVEAGLSTATKQSVLASLKKETDAIVKGRADMQQEDTVEIGLQRKIAEAEAELNRLGY